MGEAGYTRQAARGSTCAHGSVGARLAVGLALWICGSYGPSSAAVAPVANAERGACHTAAAEMEARFDIPRQLLAALALAESGRWNAERRESFAWPWTVTAGGTSRYLESKEAAIVAVRKLREQGVRNIDVGCMQINLLHHPDAFASLDAAFDPMHNTAYGADFLRRLHEEVRGWSVAIGYYHSRTREHWSRYRIKVYKLWRLERRRAAAIRRQQVITAFNERKARREARRQAAQR